ncbi:MAG: SPFH domain-containing protein [Microscillaceae bacterium]|nr:SPFH domain-containing protein [Microscillaceae bacterium]
MKYIIRIGIITSLVLVIVFISTSFVTVGPGKVGVVAHFGKIQTTTLSEGIYFITPIRTKVTLMDVRIQKLEVDATASSKDLQTVTSRVALNFSLSNEKAALIFQKLGPNYEESIIQPTIQESIKSATANYTAEELITKRPNVKQEVYEYIKKRLGQNYIIVSDFSIVDFKFSDEFNRAIESKEVAKQKALTARNDLERIRTEAEQARVKAEGQADAQNLLREALSEELLRLKAIEKWDGVLPIVQGEGSGAFVDIGTVLKSRK